MLDLVPAATSTDADIARLAGLIDSARSAMEAEMQGVRERCETYLNWYSPPYSTSLRTHDAWWDPIQAQDVDLTRNNFPISRAVVDIWTALEAAKPPTLWAQPERVMPAPPSLDQATELRGRLVVGAIKKYRAAEAMARSNLLRDYMKWDKFALQAYLATRRKNLYGFAWTKVWPHPRERRPVSYTLRDPTTVYPIWSDREPGELEAVLVAYQKSAVRANAEYGLGFDVKDGQLLMGRNSAYYRDINNRWWGDRDRLMVWLEEYWWRDVTYDANGFPTDSTVHCVKRVFDRIVKAHSYPGWRLLPWVFWENSDERDAFGWSDIASVIDINDEFNRRLSQEGDIIGSYSAPRFQLTGSFAGRDVEMPGPFELISLADQERIEQILTRIDVYPTQQHFQILTDLLHRVSGLPPIVWGLIANAQTSGRALSASWKATEARLAPKLLRDERSYDDYLALSLQYATLYDWRGAGELFGGDEPFRDFRWAFPPMEPRDFQEVTQNELTKRDGGLTSTLAAIRATGDPQAEDTLEEVLAEKLNIFLHPADVQAYLLAQRAELDNIAYASQLGVNLSPGGGAPGGAINPATVAGAVGLARETQLASATPPPAAEPGTAPPTQTGAVGNAAVPAAGSPGAGGGPPGETLTSGTLVRQGKVSNQFLQTRRL